MLAAMAPAGDSTGAQGAGPSLSALSPSDIHVLLVDDERLTRLVVGNLLRFCKYKVTIAESGTQALDVLSKAGPGAFQLILTDVMMPDVGGLELLRFVRNHQHLYNVPVIMMSASEEQETMCAALLGSADEYLVKPVTRKEVQNIWMHVMKRYHAAAAQPAAAPEAVQESAQAAAPGAGGMAGALPAAGASTAVPAGPRGNLLSLGMGLGPGLGLSPQVAADMMRVAALAASTTAARGGDGGAGEAAAHPAALAEVLAGEDGQAAAAASAMADGTAAPGTASGRPHRGLGAAQHHPSRPHPHQVHQQRPAAVTGGGSGASKVNLLKWLRRSTRCVQPKESFRIFCEVLLLLDSCHAAHGARACGLRPSKLVLYSNGRVAFAPLPTAPVPAAAAGGPCRGGVPAAGDGRKRRRQSDGVAPGGGGDDGGSRAGDRGESGVGGEGGGGAGGTGGCGSCSGGGCRGRGGGRGCCGGRCRSQQLQQQEEEANNAAAAAGLSSLGCAGHRQHTLCQQPPPPSSSSCRAAAETLTAVAEGPQAAALLDGGGAAEAQVGVTAGTAEGSAHGAGGAGAGLTAAAGDGTGTGSRAGTAAETGSGAAAGAAGAGAAAETGSGAAAGAGAGAAPSLDDEDEDALYRSPEEEQGKPSTSASDMFSLGLLFFELFYSCGGSERAGLLRDARQRTLPRCFGRQQPKEAAFALALLHPDPASRPTLAELLGSAMFRATCTSLRQRSQQQLQHQHPHQQQQVRRRAGEGLHADGNDRSGGEGSGGGEAGGPGSVAAVVGPGGLTTNGDAPGASVAQAANPHPEHSRRPGHGNQGSCDAAAKKQPQHYQLHRLATASGGGAAADAAALAGAGPLEGSPEVGGGAGAGALGSSGGVGVCGSAGPSPSGGGAAAHAAVALGGLRVDDAVLLEFLRMLQKRKLAELAQVDTELTDLTADAQMVEQYLQYLLQMRTAKRQRGAAAIAAPAPPPLPQHRGLAPKGAADGHGHHKNDDDIGIPEGDETAAVEAAADPNTSLLAVAATAAALPSAPAGHCAAWSEQHQAAQTKWCRIAHKYEQLEPVFRERRRPPQPPSSSSQPLLPGPPQHQHQHTHRQPQDWHGRQPASAAVEAGAPPATQQQQQRLRRHADAGGLPEPLVRFAEDLAAFATYTTLTPAASLRYGDPPSSSCMVAGAAFDRDDELLAVAGVSKRIKIYEKEAVLKSEVGAHYPVLEISSRSRLSSVTWSGYIKGHLASADYEGVVQLWDANTNTELMAFEEHRKRVWSIDFSQADPARLLSGGDDGLVKLWSIQHDTSTATIDLRANVCSVQFSPHSPHILAAGCANYRICLYDIRNTARALHVLPGHSRAVSYVRFLSASQLVSASTDNTLRLWQLDRPGPDGTPRCVRTFHGHCNERNFTGLSVTPEGYIACGSENNRVFCYHHSMPMPVAMYDFSAPEDALHGHHHHHRGLGPTGIMETMSVTAGGPAGRVLGGAGAGAPASMVSDTTAAAAASAASQGGHFVSSVCWSRRGNLLLAANSVGLIKLLTLH